MMQAQPRCDCNPFATSQAAFDGLCQWLRGPEALAMQHTAIERVMATDGRELLRLLVQDHLDLRGAREKAAPPLHVVGDDGVDRPHRRDATRDLRMLMGDVTVPRVGYSQRGETSRFPTDAALNLPQDPFSLGVRYAVACAVATCSFEESVAHVEQNTGTHVAKRQAEQLARAAAVDFAAFYAQRVAPAVEETSSLLVLTTDAKGIVVRTQDLREATRRAAGKRRPKLKTRLTRGEKKHAKRMAQVAAVYTVAPFARTAADVLADLTHDEARDRSPRPKAQGKRVWASIALDTVDTIREMFDEAERRDPEHRKRWVVVVDGNKDQLLLIQSEASRRDVRITIVVDFIHVLQYLWAASTAFHGETASAREEWVLTRLGEILRGRASDVAAGMRRSATLRALPASDRVAVDDCADYLLDYKAFLHYDEYLCDGLPIASGVIEGACRHLVKDRMDLSGAHWSLFGAEAVLQLRALRSSGDLAEYWAFHEQQEFERNHAARYTGSVPIPVLVAKRPNLRLVKP